MKSLGYLVSVVSVLLLGTVAMKSASKEPLLLLCLIAGMATSIIGMGLRFLSYKREEEKQA